MVLEHEGICNPRYRMSAGLQILLEHYTHCSQGICNPRFRMSAGLQILLEHYTHCSQGICNPRYRMSARLQFCSSTAGDARRGLAIPVIA